MHPTSLSATDTAFAGLAWAIARVVAVLLCILLLQIIAMRAVLERRRHRRDRFRALWEPLLASCIDTEPETLPALRPREVPEFLLLWNYFQESVRDAASDRLNGVARRLGLMSAAVEMIHDRNVSHRLIALTTLGHLRDTSVREELAAIACNAETVVSLCAAKALMRIDPDAGTSVVVPMIEKRTDWAPAAIASILLEGGPDAFSQPLADAAVAAQPARTALHIRLLEFAHPHIAAGAIRNILERRDETDIVTACLHIVQDPQLLGEVRERLSDGRWQVRVHAAHALGRLGGPADEALLIRSLGDDEWWVRYRAAQAISALPTTDLAHLRDLSQSVADPFGRDMLRQIVAERELAC